MATEVGLGLEITELRLGLPGVFGSSRSLLGFKNEKKRAYSEIVSDVGDHSSNGEDDQRKISTKKNEGGSGTGGDVVGWPPVCSYRKKINTSKKYVKVSMDGAPFLRKVDLSSQKGYSNLVIALEKLFGCFRIGEGMKDSGEKMKYKCDYVAIYEDKDGDWMLLGDVPWEMFSETCKRLRIMKRSDANVIGVLHPNK